MIFTSSLCYEDVTCQHKKGYSCLKGISLKLVPIILTVMMFLPLVGSVSEISSHNVQDVDAFTAVKVDPSVEAALTQSAEWYAVFCMPRA